MSSVVQITNLFFFLDFASMFHTTAQRSSFPSQTSTELTDELQS